MTVITRFIVERDGEEKMTFANKKEADAYDKELDIAEAFQLFLEKSDLDIDDQSMENLSLYIAKYRADALLLLKGIQPKEKSASTESEVITPIDEGKAKPGKKSKATKRTKKVAA